MAIEIKSDAEVAIMREAGKIRFLGGTFHPLVLVFAASGSAMISTVRIPKI